MAVRRHPYKKSIWKIMKMELDSPSPQMELKSPSPQVELEIPFPMQNMESEDQFPQVKLESSSPQMKLEIPFSKQNIELQSQFPQMELESQFPEVELESPSPQMELQNPFPQMDLESLTCPVCLDVMCDPVMLPLCGHSLCRVCLANITPLPPCCPVCRKEHRGPSPMKLPTNFAVANLTSSHLKIENNTSVRKRSLTVMEIPSAPPFSSATENDQEIILNSNQNFPEVHYVDRHHPTLQNTKSSEMTDGKNIDSSAFSCIHVLQLVLITVIILGFKVYYLWMILDWLFNITQKNFIYIEKLYLLIFGCSGLPKFIHLVYRFFKGSPTNFEISLFVHYFIFDIVWIIVGIVFEVNVEVFLRVTIPSTIIMGFGISVSALSVTTLPLTPEMKATSGCARFTGYIFLGLSVIGFICSFLAMIVLGSINFTGYEQLYLIVAGTCGIQTSFHAIYRLMNGKSFKWENYLFILYLLIHSSWFLVGLSGVIPLSRLVFWLSSTPSLTIIVINILISSHSLTPALLLCCANTYNTLI
ncbi:unnamed protein product [Meganyctiphanes norvegica]|uniref:RING-type domain-containing protein n=1 Tax=Meganyctiphanes norvegica TaxID=48144 RepID=A0AAV2PNQ5_MEGNR